VRIVDQAFPADGGARFFEVDAHHDLQLARVLLAQRQQAACVFFRRGRIVDGTGADHHQQAVVLGTQQTGNVTTGVEDQLGSGFVDRQLVQVSNRREQFFDVADSDVVGLAVHCCVLGFFCLHSNITRFTQSCQAPNRIMTGDFLAMPALFAVA